LWFFLSVGTYQVDMLHWITFIYRIVGFYSETFILVSGTIRSILIRDYFSVVRKMLWRKFVTHGWCSKVALKKILATNKAMHSIGWWQSEVETTVIEHTRKAARDPDG